ncbi:MAG: outer membrane beta-barrel protein [Prevotella sp.]|nr:outer membrane beta-barrel protein [Prevotella sp.]
MKKILMTLVLVAAVTTAVSAQQKEKSNWWGGLELRDGYILGKKTTGPDGNKPSSNNGMAFHVLGGYYLADNVSVGLGFGIDHFSNPSFSYVPAFLDLRYHPLATSKNVVVNLQTGLPLINNDKIYRGKFDFDLSVGYSIKVSRLNLIPAVGLNYTKYEEKADGNGHKRNTVYVKLGITI